jgi:hypothetical protein
VSFQITVLKVLAGSPGGHLPLADLRRDVALLISSGQDWTDLTKRIAARAPDLNIFSQAFVVRDPTGRRITAAGREFLATVEKPPLPLTQPVEVAIPAAPETVLPPTLVNARRQRRRRRPKRAGRTDAASFVSPLHLVSKWPLFSYSKTADLVEVMKKIRATQRPKTHTRGPFGKVSIALS